MNITDEYGKNTTNFDLRGETAYFELVQLVGITSRLYTCMIFQDPDIKGFVFVTVLIDLGCVGKTVGTHRKFSLLKVNQK